MAGARYRPVTPDQQRRELTRGLRDAERLEPGPARAETLAPLVREAHAARMLNLAMHAAQICIDDDPDAPTLLIDAYQLPDGDGEERLRAMDDLADLGRYLGRGDLRELAEQRRADVARRWVSEADPAELRQRLRTVTSVLGRRFADDLRDELGTGA